MSRDIDITIRITGRLLTDAEWRVSGGNTPAGFLIVHVEQHPGLPAIRACQLIGTDPTRMVAAQAKARVLRRGDAVTVYGQKLLPHGERVLELSGVTDVLPSQLRPIPALVEKD